MFISAEYAVQFREGGKLNCQVQVESTVVPIFDFQVAEIKFSVIFLLKVV